MIDENELIEWLDKNAAWKLFMGAIAEKDIDTTHFLAFSDALSFVKKEIEKGGFDIKVDEEIKDLLEQGFYFDGAHHKQWCLVQIAKKLGVELEEGSYEEGIAP